jgi:hypothetical protein
MAGFCVQREAMKVDKLSRSHKSYNRAAVGAEIEV